MPRPCTPLPSRTEQHMRMLLKRATSVRDVQRIQCILFRVAEQFSSDHIATLVGLSVPSVRRIWSQYLHDGDPALLGEKRGQGRFHAHLSTAKEQTLLAPFLKRAEAGGIITIRMVHAVVCAKVGKKVAPSTTYRMLHRHGWRKLVPRPQHPNANAREQERFKALFPPDHRSGTSGS